MLYMTFSGYNGFGGGISRFHSDRGNEVAKDDRKRSPLLFSKGEQGGFERFVKSPFDKGGLVVFKIPWIDGYGIFVVTMLCLKTRVQGGFLMTHCVLCG